MIFYYIRASNGEAGEVELNTLEDLMKYIKECGSEVIVYDDKRICIYDDYIE